MADRLYLSYWLRGFTEHNMLGALKSALEQFPFSRLNPRAVLQTRAVDLSEPPLLERDFSGDFSVDDILEAARWHHNLDCAYEIETAWDLWQLQGEEWRLAPSRIIISCFAPLFPSESGEQILFEFGVDTQFLPQLELAGSIALVRHNIRSLLHLVNDLDSVLAVEKRLLWSESGENFAEQLQAALAD